MPYPPHSNTSQGWIHAFSKWGSTIEFDFQRGREGSTNIFGFIEGEAVCDIFTLF
jgi:hypothetical protein